jgi:hypothetical protein
MDTKRKSDESKSAENLTGTGAGPVGVAQPVKVPRVETGRRIFGNGDTDRDGTKADKPRD